MLIFPFRPFVRRGFRVRRTCRPFFATLIFFSLLTPAVSVRAAAKPAYDASIIAIQAPRTLAPGQTSTVTVSVKNIGSKTWQRTGKNYVSIYNWNPKTKLETPSVFAATGWETTARPVKLAQASLAPNGDTNFSFPIHAPNKPGSYHADLIVTAEGVAWMPHGKFAVDVLVAPASTQAPAVSEPPATVVSTPAVTPGTQAWAAELTKLPGTEWQIEMEDHVTVELAFKNIGTQTWKNDGKSYVSLYATDGTKERSSTFHDGRWLGPSQTGKLVEAEVKPGQVGHFTFDLRAPRAPGAYHEEFTLAAEDTAWISGGKAVLPVRVPTSGEFIATAPPDSVAATTPGAASGAYAATLLLRSVKEIVLSGNARQELTFGFKNTGTSLWTSRSLRVKGVVPALVGSGMTLRDESWLDAAEPVRVSGTVNPGEIGFLAFKLKVPARKGTYQASFQLYADGQPVEGGEVDIPITVTADGYIEPEPTPTPTTSSGTPAPAYNAIPLSGDVSTLPDEPMIRVGIFATTDDRMVVRAKYAPLSVLQGGASVCGLAIGQSITVSYDRTNRVYRLSDGPCVGQASSPYVVHADDNLSPMEMADFTRLVSWLPGANDNTFRAQLELRYTPATDKVWVINELPIEWYLKGIGETSNSSPQEYQRALLTAARTYAMYHVQRGTKHANESYIVDATYDQVYRGYGAESRDPNVVSAVDATRGQIVTYQGKLAITPYYSRSDGRTRAWSEVWGGGGIDWLVSVPVPWDQGKTLWGHGVGLSATGALGAANDGWTYDRILTYFYTGTELRRAYK